MELNMQRKKALQLLQKYPNPVEIEKHIFNLGFETYSLYIRRLLRGIPLDDAMNIDKFLYDFSLKTQQKNVADGDIQCFKCKSFKIERMEVQTRSADESATVFCKCTGCGHRFKI